MRGIAHIGDRCASTLLHRAEVEEGPPTPDRYSGLQFFAALGETIHEREAAPATDWLGNNKRVAVGTIGLERLFRRYEECPLGFVRRFQIERDRIHAVALPRRIWTKQGIEERADPWDAD